MASQQQGEHRRRGSSTAVRWYLKEWMQHFDKRQADLSRALDYDKASAHKLWHDKQSSFGKQQIAELAGWLKITPAELFVPPEQALKDRAIVAGGSQSEAALASRVLALEQAMRDLGKEVSALAKLIRAEKPRTFSVTVGTGYVRPERRKPPE